MTSDERREARYQRRKAKREAHKSATTFEEVFSMDNLWTSIKKCFRGVGWKASTQRVKVSQLSTLYTLYSQLHAGTYKSRGFYEFYICERGKRRHIQATHITERIVQKCLCSALWPIITPTLVKGNSASQKGRGVKYARDRFANTFRQSHDYVLTYDIHSYFASIRHDKAKEIFARRLRDARLIALCNQFIDEFDGDVGVGLGSEISQIVAIAYLNPIDHIGEQYGEYGRYMDDGNLFGTKDAVMRYLAELYRRLSELGLCLNKKTQVNKVENGAVFLKRLHKGNTIVLVAKCRKHIMQRCRKMQAIDPERREAAFQTYRAIIAETDENKARWAFLNWPERKEVD